MAVFKLLLLPGDGIGPEVMAEVSRLRNRIAVFVNLPFEGLDRLSLQSRLNEIGRLRDQQAHDQ